MSSKRPPDVDVRQSIRDIFFTKNAYRLVDDYVLQDGWPHPFAVLVPGGGYQAVCSFIEGVPIAKKLNELGISAFIVYYRTKKRAAFPNPQDDLARAVREILANAERYHLITKNYSVWGASAGGHLAASFGTTSIGYKKYGLPKPGAMVLLYPVISMDPAVTHKQTHDALAGQRAYPAMEALTSVDLQVNADYPPTYLWCGDEDDLVSPKNSKRMAAALQAAGVPVQFDMFPGVGHGVGPGTGTSASGWIDRAVAFWKNQA